MTKINRMKWPHRGILSILAKEYKTSPANIKKALDRVNPNPNYAARYDAVLRDRLKKIESYNESIRNSA